MNNSRPQSNWRETLSKKDKTAYILIEASLTLLSVLCLLVYLSVKSVIAFWNNNVLANNMQTGTYYISPLCFLIFAAVCYIDANYRRSGVTLFKSKNTTCCHTAKKEHIKKREKQDKAKKILFWTSLFTICVIISLFGVLQRTVIYNDGSIHTFGNFGNETSVVSTDNVTGVIITATEYRRKTPEDTDVYITVNCEGSQSYVFNIESFIGHDYYTDNAIEGMIRIKELYSGVPLTIEGEEKLEAFRELYELSEKENKLLDKLFEIN